MTTTEKSMWEAALLYTRAGLSVLPIRGDGSKSPALETWKEFQTAVPDEDQLAEWFLDKGDIGIGIIGGMNDIEILDFDRPGIFEEFQDLVEEVRPGLLDRFPRVETPSGGVHLYCRCEAVEGNQKLAWEASGKTLIETRGRGGYVVAPPSPPCCHPVGKPYVHVGGPELPDTPYISPDDRKILFEVARSLNELPERKVEEPHQGPVGNRPGDVFNAKGSWEDILVLAGWTVTRSKGDVLYWRKPTASGPGHHATTGHTGDLFYCFSTSASPFEAGTAYTKFTAFALLHHGGDYAAAAQELSRKGYGRLCESPVSREVPLVDTDTPNEAPDDPHRLARLFAKQKCHHPQGSTLRFWRGEWHSWKGNAYRPLPTTEVKAGLCEVIKEEFNRVNLLDLRDYQRRATEGKLKRGEEHPTVRKVTQTLVGNVVQALTGLTVLPASTEQPAWLDGESDLRADEVLAAANGLVHLPSYVRGEHHLLEATPRFFTANALDFPFQADAPPPKAWLEFLGQLWPKDAGSVETLQEWAGYSLLPDTRLQKMLLLVGPKRSGKGTIARVLTGLVGAANVAGPTLSGLATPFGLAPLLGKSLAIISDARLSGRTDAAVITERLLSISGEDMLTIDRKHLAAVSVKLPTRFMVLTNELPRLTDASGALAGRMVVLRLTESWYAKEDPGLTNRLLAELPGILLWAIEGWQRLRSRNRFSQPDSGKELLGQLEDLTSPIGEFLRECCEVGPEYQTPKKTLFERWQFWCGQNGREHSGDAATFGRNLLAAVPSISRTSPRDGAGRLPTYAGIRLRGR